MSPKIESMLRGSYRAVPLSTSPADEKLARSPELPSVNEPGERGRGRLGPPTRQTSQTSEHGVGLLEPNVLDLGAVAGMPAQRRPPKPPRIVDQEQNELEGVRKADEVELGCGGERDRWLPVSRARRRRP